MEIHEEKGQGEEEQEEAASMRATVACAGATPHNSHRGNNGYLQVKGFVINSPPYSTFCIALKRVNGGAYDIGALVEARASLLPTCRAGAPIFLFSGMPCLDSSSKTTNGLKT
ncbi:hypothetical protein Goshw_013463 [Gossypium schwendimanii]|uniref:Uncharacterized protein n=1 Tax=Gossypium schwendimanii TaxID=34291 RepID=A0A7J9N009_GOSSC|nr:hypothetical protein [Gossypium schwendimanii]